MKKFLIALLFAPVMAFAAGAALHLDKWPGSVSDKAALQNGAKLFVNYCLSCHSASYMRYKNLMDLGLTEAQVKDNLMFAGEKIGDLMTVAARYDEQKKWFGATPPDLTIVARARGDAGAPKAGADWLYTYLRTFYRDDARPTGWNNVAFAAVGMPHVLWELQGTQVMNHETHKLELAVPGKMSPAEYDKAVSDLVGFMVWMGEPQQEYRQTLGIFVLLFLAVLFVVAYALKKEYWKDIH
ncbi:cytochrome c1 [Azonexus caeni]|uniref:cytochrome c1 n=1 Tax=Azonexus caeni TaxID=266126 RepID=UPI002D075EF3|nr:cytochrome c1 [Azonexus sp.]